VAVSRIGEPQGHLAGDHRAFHRLGPRTHALITEERHRRDLCGAMTDLAVLLQDRQHILIECDGFRSGGETSAAKPTTTARKLTATKGIIKRSFRSLISSSCCGQDDICSATHTSRGPPQIQAAFSARPARRCLPPIVPPEVLRCSRPAKERRQEIESRRFYLRPKSKLSDNGP
jgi:hypothetical protein